MKTLHKRLIFSVLCATLAHAAFAQVDDDDVEVINPDGGTEYPDAADGWKAYTLPDRAGVAHAGTYDDPKLPDEQSFRGAVHLDDAGFFRSEFDGSPTTPPPITRVDTPLWTYLSDHAGTIEDPRAAEDKTYIGAVHYYDGALYQSSFAGVMTVSDFADETRVTMRSGVRAIYITSDPQYPWTAKTDKGEPESLNSAKSNSRALISNQYNAIQRTRNLSPKTPSVVVINGDFTAYGHGWQLDTMHDLTKILKPPILLGMGNHDYQNNVNNCANNGCAKSSLLHLYGQIINHVSPSSFDMYRETASQFESYNGSFAYRYNFEDTAIFQLQNYPGYSVEFSSGRPVIDKKRKFRISPSTEWMVTESNNLGFESPMNTGIINMHDVGHANPQIKDAINDYWSKIIAVFGGHWHTSMGRYNNPSLYGNIPVFISGSASQQTFLLVHIYDGMKKMFIYGIRNNDINKRILLCKIDTSLGAEKGCMI